MKDENLSPDFLELKGKHRVFSARRKLNQAGLVSHITQRAPGKEKLFHEDEDYLTMLWLLKDTAKRFDLKFHAFCLLSNHVHFLLQTCKDNLSQAMHSVFFRYGMRYNRKYERRGHIFGGAFRQAVCLDNSYFLTASVYIHLNPVRAGLVLNAGDYRWSSVSLYCYQESFDSFVTPDSVLSLLDPDPSVAREYYSSLLQGGKDIETDNVLEQETAINKIVSRLADNFPWLFKKVAQKGPVSGQSGQKLLEQPQLEEMIKKVPTWKPRSAQTRQAKKYLVEQLLARGFNKTEIAAKLKVSRKTVYNMMNS